MQWGASNDGAPWNPLSPLLRYLVLLYVSFHHFACTRYFNTDSRLAFTGTSNCAANAAVLVYLKLEFSISQSPPIGSFTCTLIGVSLWFRIVISNSICQTRSLIRL